MMLAGIVGFFIPAIMHIEDNRRPEDSTTPEPVSAPGYAN